MSKGEKKLKHGEVLFEEGKPITSAYMLRVGRLSLFVERGGKRIEVQRINSPAIIGAETIKAEAKHLTSGMAQGQLTYLEVPIELIKNEFDKTPPAMKILLKGQIDNFKAMQLQIKSYKLEEDPSLIPQKLIPRIFCSIALTGSHLGLNLKKIRDDEENGKTPFNKNNSEEVVLSSFEDENSVKIAWSSLKLYTTRYFMESHKKVEYALQILSKLKLAELIYVENDDGIEELKDVHLHQLEFIESFADFFQYNLYKGSTAMISYDKKALDIARAIVGVSEGVEPDFRGSTVLNYDKMLADIKEKFKLDFKADHINLLEQKGLFVKRQSQEGGMKFAFDCEEFEKTVKFWILLKEINDLNEKGFVDLKEPESVDQVSDGSSCPECQNEVQDGQNFCGNCGHKMAA